MYLLQYTPCVLLSFSSGENGLDSSALALLADNKMQYSERREQKKELDRLQAEVNFRKITGWFKMKVAPSASATNVVA